MFDMTKVKIGDKLVTRGGLVVVCESECDPSDEYLLWGYAVEDGLCYVTKDGYYWDDGTLSDYDIVGFANEQPTESEAENKGVKSDQREHNHYFKDVRHLDFIDVYRVIELWELKDPALQHALKKLLVPGNRGHKDKQKDIQDVIDSCKRWQEMQAENEIKGYPDE